jgi:ABC-type branched-subunit amino acid transport system ATPase component/ABC-type branched-subunit amino acid transport system permease subunit
MELTRDRKVIFGFGVIVGLLVAWKLADIFLPHHLPGGVVLEGVVVGALSSLVAMGLVIVYKSARVINFAQAEIGGVASSAAVALVLGNHWSYFPAVIVGLLIAVVIGILIDRIIVWRFQNAPRLILTVATIGLMQLFGAIEYEIPNLYKSQSAFSNTNRFGIPWHVNVGISGFTFNGNSFGALIVIPVLLLLLWLFMNRTDSGAGIRACADSSDRATLLGIPVRRLSLLSWVVASLLAGISSILYQPIQGFQAGQPLGASFLIVPIAAAAVGKFESLPITFIASVVLGVFQEAVYWSFNKSTTVELGFFIVLFLALSFQRKSFARVWDLGLGAFKAVQEVRPLQKSVAELPQVKALKYATYAVFAILFLVLPAFHLGYFSTSHLLYGATIAIFAIIAVSLVVLTGWAGQLSFGQFAFAAAGASATSVALMSWHINVALALLFSVIVGGILSLIVGIPALRLPGLNLAVITFAFYSLVNDVFINGGNFPKLVPQKVTFGPLFSRFDLTNDRILYYVCVVVLIFVIWGANNMLKTRPGRVIRAVKDNERAGSSYGASPLRSKLLAFGFSGAVAGIAGGLYVISLGAMPQGGFDPSLSINIFAMVAVGGMGSLLGGVLGAAVFEFIYFWIHSTALEYFATGGLLTLVLYVIPDGLGAQVYKFRDWLISQVVKDKEVIAEETVDSTIIPGPAHEAALRLSALEDLELASKRIERQQQAVKIGDPKQAMLACVDVDAGYGRSQILYGISLDIAPGEILALLGTNGAGKSTVLRVFSGLLNPTHGEVYFAGEEISKMKPTQRVKNGLVMVPGGRGVFQSLTVRENLRLAAWTTKKDRKFVAETTAQVFELFPALRDRLNVKAGFLSGGEQQMLTIAQSFYCKPRIILIDELSLGLAPTVVAQLLNAVRAMAARGITVVVVEQSVNVATAIAKRAVFLERGQVRFSGPTPSLEQQPNLLRSVFLRAATKAQARPKSEHEAKRMIDRQSITAFGVSRISKRYGNVMALEDINLSVSKGEIFGIIGSNGAGKTTLFDVCSGFLTPDTGRVVMEGVDITALEPYQRAIRGLGRVFQDALLFPSLTVAEVLAVALERHIEVKDPLASMLGLEAVSKSEEKVADRVDELIELMGLGKWRNSFVSELSTGTRRVVDLACAMAHRPRVLLLDEPSSGIAQRESEAMGELLLGLRTETGASFIVIEHDVPLVSYISDRLMCLHLGKVIAEGEPTAVLADPAVIAAYLGQDEATIQRSRTAFASAGAPTAPTGPSPAPPVPPPVPGTSQF